MESIEDLTMSAVPGWDEWYSRGEKLAKTYKQVRKDMAYWLAEGEAKFGEDAQQAMDLFDLTHETLSNYASAGRRVPRSVLPDDPKNVIGLSHMQAVAALYERPDDQRQLLSEVVSGDIEDRATLRNRVKALLPDHAGVSESVIEWHECGTLETVAGEESSLWHKVMGLLIKVARGHRIRITIYEAEEHRVDLETGEVVNA
jgi:hypothetical protein